MKKKLHLTKLIICILFLNCVTFSYGQVDTTNLISKEVTSTVIIEFQARFAPLRVLSSGSTVNKTHPDYTLCKSAGFNVCFPIGEKMSLVSGVGLNVINGIKVSQALELIDMTTQEILRATYTLDNQVSNKYITIPTIIKYTPVKILNFQFGVNHNFEVSNNSNKYIDANVGVYSTQSYVPSVLLAAGINLFTYFEVGVNYDYYFRDFANINRLEQVSYDGRTGEIVDPNIYITGDDSQFKFQTLPGIYVTFKYPIDKK